MKVLVLGAGGREHALVWKLLQSPRVELVYCAPGNGGICAESPAGSQKEEGAAGSPNEGERIECIPWDGKDFDAILGTASKLAPDLTIVGPELPLTLGIVDQFQQRGLKIFGPTKAAARLESSKGFAKEFMRRHNISTAKYAVCATEKDVTDALAHFHGRIVVKADGLAAGKGVVIAADKTEALALAIEMLSGKSLGSAGAQVVLEEFLEGEELSFLVMSDGERVAPLAPAQDHKRIGEGDTGPNTGGMGAYSADFLLEPQMRDWLVHHIAQPVIAGMKQEGAEYRGVLYCGLMMTARGPQVLEFNCRFGDPETQPVLMRLESDLVEALEDSAEGRMSEGDLSWSRDAAVCIVLASAGYPGAFSTGKQITGLDRAEAIEGVKVFHAGTKRQDDGMLVTTAGRVLGVTARAATLDAALDRAYRAAELIHFEGKYYRHDIAAKAVSSPQSRGATEKL